VSIGVYSSQAVPVYLRLRGVGVSVVQVKLTRGQKSHVTRVSPGRLTLSRSRSKQIRGQTYFGLFSVKPWSNILKHRVSIVRSQYIKNIVSLFIARPFSMSKHWSWGHFITDGQFFRNNNLYKNAWCLACLNHHKDMLWESNIVSTALNGMGGGRTDAEQEAQGTSS
jgi:hypothetical protein